MTMLVGYRAGRAGRAACTWPACWRARAATTSCSARSSRCRGRPAPQRSTPSTAPISTGWRTRRSTRRARGCPRTSRRQFAGPSRALRSGRPGGGGRAARRQPDRRRARPRPCLRARVPGQRHDPPAAQLPRSRSPCRRAGTAAARDSRVERVTAAFGGSETDDLVVGAAGVAAHVGASLRVASFAVRSRPPTRRRRKRPRQAMIQQWDPADPGGQPRDPGTHRRPARGTARARDRHRLRRELGRGAGGHRVGDGDVLVVGSSAVGPLARVFLGSRRPRSSATPRSPSSRPPRRVAELAEEAESAGP